MAKRRARGRAEGSFLEHLLTRLNNVEMLLMDLHWNTVGQQRFYYPVSEDAQAGLQPTGPVVSLAELLGHAEGDAEESKTSGEPISRRNVRGVKQKQEEQEKEQHIGRDKKKQNEKMQEQEKQQTMHEEKKQQKRQEQRNEEQLVRTDIEKQQNMRQPDETPEVNNPIAPGSIVRIKGLRKRSDLNGKQAKVLTFDAGSGRFECQLVSETSATRTIGCKLENLTLLSQNDEGLSETSEHFAGNARNVVVCSTEALSADDVQYYFESCFGDVQDVKPNPDGSDDWIVTFADSDVAASALHITTHQILREFDDKLVAAVCHSVAA